MQATQPRQEVVGEDRRTKRLALLGVLALGLLIGTRDLLTGRLPAVGQFAPFPRPSTLLTHFVDGWRTTGMGSAAPGPPAFGILGVLGIVLTSYLVIIGHL